MTRRRKEHDSLKRKAPTRRYRKVFWIGAEGQTERDYFTGRSFQSSNVAVRFPGKRSSQTSPGNVLKRFTRDLAKQTVRSGDELWLVVDTDEWTQRDFDELLRWMREDDARHLAVSNPKFELFLVMHFEPANVCTTAASVDSALKRHIPDYHKRLAANQFGEEQVRLAINHARARRQGDGGALPSAGNTDAYLLAEHILDA